MTGTWVRRGHLDQRHYCQPPRERHVVSDDRVIGPLPDRLVAVGEVTGSLGDLWRCECGTLWQVVDACTGTTRPCDGDHGGQHEVTPSRKWKPAGWWLRWRHRAGKGAR